MSDPTPERSCIRLMCLPRASAGVKDSAWADCLRRPGDVATVPAALRGRWGQMSTLFQAIVVIGAAVVLVLTVNAYDHRRIPIEVLERHNEVAGAIMAVVGGMYGILLAFCIVAAWDDFERARFGVSEEASAINNLYRVAEALPAPVGPKVRELTLHYFSTLIDDEWPRMRKREVSHTANLASVALWRTISHFEPQTEGQRDCTCPRFGFWSR